MILPPIIWINISYPPTNHQRLRARLLLLSRIITKLSTKQADLSFAFDDAENLQAVAMTDKQMEETQGAWVPNVVGGVAGGLGGHFGYMSSVVTSGQYNFGGHLASVGLGALGGVASPATGIGSVAWGLGFGTASGAATGYLTSKFPTINVK